MTDNQQSVYQDDLIVWREYLRQEREKGFDDDAIFDTLLRIKLSKSGEWLILFGSKAKAFMHANSQAGKSLWQACQKWEKSMHEVRMTPCKNKFGFDLVPGEGLGNWSFNSNYADCLYVAGGLTEDGRVNEGFTILSSQEWAEEFNAPTQLKTDPKTHTKTRAKKTDK